MRRLPRAYPTTRSPRMASRSRIKAAFIAAPAIGYTFTKDALASLTAPIQLWRTENDQITPNPRER